MIAKVKISHLLIAVIIGLGLCFMFSMFSKPSTSIDKLQADTDRSLGAIKAESSSVGVEIGRSQVATGNAIEAISRSQTEIDGSRKAVDGIEAGIREIESILAECEELARKNSNIIERIDGANQ